MTTLCQQLTVSYIFFACAEDTRMGNLIYLVFIIRIIGAFQ